jgi:hypothetical protein
MGRVYDYNQFSFSKTGANRGDYSFGHELKYIDIDIHNRPEEYENISDSKAFINYSVSLEVRKTGIESIFFNVDSVELEFSVDDYPNPGKDFDIDLIPGKTIDIGQVAADVDDCQIPTYPTELLINMNGSTDPKKFNVTVKFGTSS